MGFSGIKPGHIVACGSICRDLKVFKKVCHRLSSGAYIQTVKLVARTEASSSALRFRVFMNCGFRLGARSEVGRRGSEGPSEGIRRIRRGPLRRSLRPPPADFAGDRPRESIANRVFGCWQNFFGKSLSSAVTGCIHSLG